MAGQSEHLNRLLTLVPYFLAHNGIALEQAAADLNIDADTLVADLEQLSMCGLPGEYQLEMIDFYTEDDRVYLSFVHGDMNRPLRLTSAEATVLLMALRTVTETGAIDPDAVARAVAKIEAAVGTQLGSTQSGGTQSGPELETASATTSGGREAIYETVRQAVATEHALRITYYTPSRDSLSERVVDPVATQVFDSGTYLSAWCRESEDMRLFRFDRIDHAEVLDEPSKPPVQARQTSQSPVLSDDPGLPTAYLNVDASARWAFDYGMLDRVSESDGDVDAATVRYGSPDWLVRFLLGFGGQVRIAADHPGQDELERDVVAAASAARARYS